MVDTENFQTASKLRTNIGTKKTTKVRRKTKLNSNAIFTIVYKKLAPVKNLTDTNKDVTRTYTQTGCGDGDVLRYVRDGVYSNLFKVWCFPVCCLASIQQPLIFETLRVRVLFYIYFFPL